MLSVNFKTRSRVDLKVKGAYAYALDPSTEVLMLAYKFSGRLGHTWLPGQPFPAKVAAYVRAGGKLLAWNAQFDRLIWAHVLGNDKCDAPTPTLEQWMCAAAIARANGLPGKLSDAAEFVYGASRFYGASHFSADVASRGAALVRLFGVPQSNGEFVAPTAEPKKWVEFVTNCAGDLVTMEQLVQRCPSPSDTWMQEYTVSEKINDMGLHIDVPFARAATAWKASETVDANAAVYDRTGIRALAGEKIARWVYDRLPDGMRSIMQSDDVSGLSLDASARETLLDEGTATPRDVRDVLRIIDEAQSSSQYARMVDRAGENDARIRGAFIHEGAGTSGRFASVGVQMHNLPRNLPDNVEVTRTAVVEGHVTQAIEASGQPTATKLLRSMLCSTICAAPGHTFVWGKWGQIEGRVNPWLAGPDIRAQDRVAAYSDPSRDIYCETASGILGRTITKRDPERQAYGKIPELVLGYGGGVEAFAAMAEAYGVSLPANQIESIVQDWRRDQAWAPDWWKQLEKVALQAMRHPGQFFSCGHISMLSRHEFQRTLDIILPSGRALSYPYACIEQGRFQHPTVTVARATRHLKRGHAWPRRPLWGRFMCKETTQAAQHAMGQVHV